MSFPIDDLLDFDSIDAISPTTRTALFQYAKLARARITALRAAMSEAEDFAWARHSDAPDDPWLSIQGVLRAALDDDDLRARQ